MMTATESPLLDAALGYAARGWHVLPLHSVRGGRCTCGRDDCGSPAKHPVASLAPNGLKNASAAPDVIRGWWTQCPWANVGVATGAASGLIVLDIDPRSGGDETLDVLTREHGPLPATPMSLTGGGGQHYLFQHPGGECKSRHGLFLGIDLKADGGYIVCPPSRHASGGVYCWHRSPGELPTVPMADWVAAALATTRETPTAPEAPRHERNGQPAGDDWQLRAHAYSAKYPPAAEGDRNNRAYVLTGHLRAIPGGERQSEATIASLVRRWNAANTPPLPDGELLRTVRSSLAGKPFDPKPDRPRPATAKDSEQPRPESTIKPEYRTATDLMQHFPRLRAPIIDGLLREGETLNLIAPQKTGKSWLVLDLALALATGRPWLGRFDTARGDVLILDNELHGETIASRIPKVAAARGIPLDEFGGRLYVDSLRGRLVDLLAMDTYFRGIAPGTFRVIILDAFYRFLPRDRDENSNADVSQLYNALDSYAGRLGCAFVLVHHASKGSQSGKTLTDVGAGASAQSRAADTHLILRAHETKGACTLDAAIRSFPPVEPFVLSWSHPVWTPAPDLDPAMLKPDRPRRPAKAADPGSPPSQPWTAARFAAEFITADGQTSGAILDAAAVAGLSENRAEKLLKRAVESGAIHRWNYGQCKPAKYANVPQPLIDVGAPQNAPAKRIRKGKNR